MTGSPGCTASRPFLGIDTATRLGGVALVDAGGVMSEYGADVKGSHAPRLMTAVARLMDESGLTLADLGGIGVSIGPGSFTGLRIGAATAMGLARGAGLKVFPVPTLEVIAHGVPRPQGALVAVVLTARRGEVYGAVYQAAAGEGGMDDVISPCAMHPDAFLTDLAALGRPVVVAGSGTPEVVSLQAPSTVSAASPVCWHPQASVVAWRARCMARAGESYAPHQISPFYLKASQAEISWDERQREMRS